MNRAPLVSLLLVVGCASPMTSLRADNKRLEKTVEELRDDRRAQDRRMKDLQHQLDEARARNITVAEAAMPQLPVEVAAPATTATNQRVVGVTDDGTEIVYEGDAAAGKAAVLEDEPAAPAPTPRRAARAPAPAADAPIPASGDRIEVTRRIPAISARAATRSHARAEAPPDRGTTGDAGEDYRAAVALVKAQQFPEAVAALRAFVAKYPRHDYADNAQYWLGETFYAQKDYPHALVEFRAVIESYPRGNKVPDALLKVGYCYGAMGQAEKSRAVLEQVVSLYPKSEPASLASKRLETP